MAPPAPLDELDALWLALDEVTDDGALPPELLVVACPPAPPTPPLPAAPPIPPAPPAPPALAFDEEDEEEAPAPSVAVDVVDVAVTEAPAVAGGPEDPSSFASPAAQLATP